MILIEELQNRKNKIKSFKNEMKMIKYQKNDAYFNSEVTAPDGMYHKCSNCSEQILTKQLVKSLFVCPSCNFHNRLKAYTRLDITFDSFEEFDEDLCEVDITFKDYKDKINEYRERTGLIDAVVTGLGVIDNSKIAVAIMDSYFMMGSMGSVVGEKITRLVEYATKHNLPLVIFTTSGGARMQEGIISLMQMAKISQAIALHKESNLYITVLTNPTTGGVSASFASLGDITIAEPNAVIGFAGRRVIEKTINETLPPEFQTSEFLLEKGFVDKVVERSKLKDTLSNILKLHGM